MIFSLPSSIETTLVKSNLATALQNDILLGRLEPGQRIVEGRWAKEYGVAQASVREAINLLIAEGFATKQSGRSARVTKYSDEDVAHIYELRAGLEGLAGRLIVDHSINLGPLDEALEAMAAACKGSDIQKLMKTDLQFHLVLCRLSGNPFLYDSVRRIIIPLFAFALTHSVQSHQTGEPWQHDLDDHQGIVRVLREGNSDLAETYIRHVLGKFAARAYRIWENR